MLLRLPIHRIRRRSVYNQQVHNYAKMSREISPPPAKRRRIAKESSEQVARQALSPPQPLPPLDKNSIRVFSWNINSIAPFLQKQITSFFQSGKAEEADLPPASLREFLRRHDWPTILLLQEVKIATKDMKTQDAVRAAINSKTAAQVEGPQYEAHFTLPNDPYNARGMRGNGKVYGVCSILRSDLRTSYHVKVRTVDWDKEGRISVVEIQKDSTKLAIFNIYAVNGTDNPYRNPNTGHTHGTRHDRKLEVHRLLMQECKDLEAKGWHVLLGGDMNVAPSSRDGHPKLRTFPHQHILNREDFHDKILEGKTGTTLGLNGVDVWRKMHGDERRFTWYSRTKLWGTSCDRVDYFVAGRKLWQEGMIVASGIMDSERERGPSDHCPLWVDVNLETNAENGPQTSTSLNS